MFTYNILGVEITLNLNISYNNGAYQILLTLPENYPDTILSKEFKNPNGCIFEMIIIGSYKQLIIEKFCNNVKICLTETNNDEKIMLKDIGKKVFKEVFKYLNDGEYDNFEVFVDCNSYYYTNMEYKEYEDIEEVKNIIMRKYPEHMNQQYDLKKLCDILNELENNYKLSKYFMENYGFKVGTYHSLNTRLYTTFGDLCNKLNIHFR